MAVSQWMCECTRSGELRSRIHTSFLLFHFSLDHKLVTENVVTVVVQENEKEEKEKT